MASLGAWSQPWPGSEWLGLGSCAPDARDPWLWVQESRGGLDIQGQSHTGRSLCPTRSQLE